MSTFKIKDVDMARKLAMKEFEETERRKSACNMIPNMTEEEFDDFIESFKKYRLEKSQKVNNTDKMSIFDGETLQSNDTQLEEKKCAVVVQFLCKDGSIRFKTHFYKLSLPKDSRPEYKGYLYNSVTKHLKSKNKNVSEDFHVVDIRPLPDNW